MFCLQFPESNNYVVPGDVVKLGRFADEEWVVKYGWYSFGGNRPVCGWYLVKDCGLAIKPLQLPDLDDIYIISR